MHCFRTGVEKGMKLCTAVQEGCGYKDTLVSIATLLRWQNISLCALLISRPSYMPDYTSLSLYQSVRRHIQEDVSLNTAVISSYLVNRFES